MNIIIALAVCTSSRVALRYNKAMASFDKIAVIYNPKSTNDAGKIAKDFARKLVGLKPELIATDHAGHAEQIAYDLSKKYKSPLIISASGDGGYNEVVNGVMRAKADKVAQDPVVAVLPAGNANDHGRTVQGDTLLHELITKASIKAMDLLKLEYIASGKEVVRYAHSYIGFGISARAGSAINKASKGGLSEIIAVASTLNNDAPVKARHGGITRKYDSLIFANIPNMAKVLKIGDKASLTDGLFEVHKITHQSFFTRLVKLLRMTALFSQKVKKYSHYSFRVMQKEKVQLDGEVLSLPAGVRVTVSSVKTALKTIRRWYVGIINKKQPR